MTATTARHDFLAAIVTVLQAQQTATPTQLRAVYSSRPGSFPETPAAYIGNADEVITYTAATRTRTFTGLTVVLVDNFADPQESGDRMDLLVDLLVERFTAAYAANPGGGSILELDTVTDTEIDLPSINGSATLIYRACILGFGSTFISEGRT